jgi:carboxyl-terminal processing protease
MEQRMSILKQITTTALLSISLTSIAIANTEQDDEAGTLPLDELRIFSEVFAKVKNDYVESVDDRELIENAIRGMLEGLDPHSSYLDKEHYTELQEGTSGEFGGLGIEVGMEDGFVKVISPIDDTPAQRAGIKAGDLIIRLDDQSVKGMMLNDAVKLMRGKPGSDIILTVVRIGEDKPIEITITRDIIAVRSVRGKTLEPGFAYIRISNFQTNTAEDLRKSLEKLKQENNNGLSGLILDLRNNPGGILNAAVGVSDLFLDSGLIVYTEGRIKDSKMTFNAKPMDMIKDAPIIVLVNGGSASASEIVAGALQDHDRAIIMGEQTFGKGSVQTILPMNEEAALKLTTARYYTPSGRSIQASGIKPDIIIDNIRVDSRVDTTSGQIKEADLSGHLGSGQEADEEDKDKSEKADDKKKGKNKEPSLAETDYQLYEALNVLKGLAIHLKKTG